MYNTARSGIIISFSATIMRDWIKDSSSTIWSHQLMLSKSKAKFCLGEYFRFVSLKLRSTTLRSNEESKKETKNRKYWKRNSEKVVVMFSTYLMKKHLGKYMQKLQNLLCFLQIKSTLMKNRYLWLEKFKFIHLRLLDNQVFLFWIVIP